MSTARSNRTHQSRLARLLADQLDIGYNAALDSVRAAAAAGVLPTHLSANTEAALAAVLAHRGARLRPDTRITFPGVSGAPTTVTVAGLRHHTLLAGPGAGAGLAALTIALTAAGVPGVVVRPDVPAERSMNFWRPDSHAQPRPGWEHVTLAAITGVTAPRLQMIALGAGVRMNDAYWAPLFSAVLTGSTPCAAETMTLGDLVAALAGRAADYAGATAPDRRMVARSIAAWLPTLAADPTPGSDLSAIAAAGQLLAVVEQPRSAGEGVSFLAVTDVDRAPRPVLRELLGRARANGVLVILASEDAQVFSGGSDEGLRVNIGLVLE